MNDITIIYTSASIIDNRLGDLVRSQLLKVSDGIPIISVTREKLNFGKNIVIPSAHGSNRNVYVAVLEATNFVNTKYCAIAEDDCLYSWPHFRFHRPSPNVFSYNENYLRIYPWMAPVFSYKRRLHFSQCVVQTETLIYSLAERLNKVPLDDDIHCEPGRYQHRFDAYGISRNDKEYFHPPLPNVLIHHENCLNFNKWGKRTKLGINQIENVEPWGNAKSIINSLSCPA
jgi:hypothetical protein